MANWTKEEEKLLKDNYEKCGNKGIAAMLKDRKPHQVAEKLKQMNLRRSEKVLRKLHAAGTGKPVPKEDLSAIRKHYKEKGKSELAAMLNCSVNRIQYIMKTNGLKRTAEELSAIRKSSPNFLFW